jgi:hypothetical protein
MTELKKLVIGGFLFGFYLYFMMHLPVAISNSAFSEFLLFFGGFIALYLFMR